jgi:hypothetical protein
VARPAATTSTTTTTTTTTTAVPLGPVAPLTGVPVPLADAGNLARPVLAVKVDGAPEAMAQAALSEADIVIEERVEGISRYLAAYHSRTPAEVGPVRSARTTDLDLLAALGRPLLAWSGGNEVVSGRVRSADWIVSLNPDQAGGAYRRSPERRAPHNLYADPLRLWEAAAGRGAPPGPVLTHRPAGAPPAGAPVAGISASVGSNATFAWDEARHGWLRWAHGRPHESPAGAQLAPTNVVVLEVDYVRSAADARSPEAVSVGGGRAWVLSAGHMAEGTWQRPDRTAPWTIADAAGSPLTVEPGTTWMVLADRPPAGLDGAVAAALPRTPPA